MLLLTDVNPAEWPINYSSWW